MSEPPSNTDSTRRYYLEAVRFDGSRTTVLGGMTWDEAQRYLEAVREANIFADVRVVPDS